MKITPVSSKSILMEAFEKSAMGPPGATGLAPADIEVPTGYVQEPREKAPGEVISGIDDFPPASHDGLIATRRSIGDALDSLRGVKAQVSQDQLDAVMTVFNQLENLQGNVVFQGYVEDPRLTEAR
jgi:hypothetical protein